MIDNHKASFHAGADLTDGTRVKLATADSTFDKGLKLMAAGPGDACIGHVTRDVKEHTADNVKLYQTFVTVARNGYASEVPAIASGAVEAGDILEAAAAGKLKTQVAEGGEGIAVALTAAADGGKMKVRYLDVPVEGLPAE